MVRNIEKQGSRQAYDAPRGFPAGKATLHTATVGGAAPRQLGQSYLFALLANVRRLSKLLDVMPGKPIVRVRRE
jgi:hypothetical protein